MLQSGTTSIQLIPLLNYISFNADYDWEQGSRLSQAGMNPNMRSGTRLERHLATVKASTILSVLLKARPINPDLQSSLVSCCGSSQGFLSWILSTLVNTFDDEIRAIGIRCLADYMDTHVPKGDTLHSLQDDNKDESTRMGGRPVGNSTRKMSVTFTSVGKSLSTAIGGQVLSTVMHTAKPVSIDIVYKLLWHLLKCHRARMGRHTHTALIYLLVEVGGHREASESLMQDFVVPDNVLQIGYRLSLKHDHDLALEIESVAGKRLRQTTAINMVLRLLRFLPNNWKEKWLLDLVTLTHTCPANIQALVKDPDWQPSLFHVISDCLEEINSKHGSQKDPSATTDALIDNTAEANGEMDANTTVKEVRSGELLSFADLSLSTPEDQMRMQARFNLALKLYSTLLGYCFRHGGEKVSYELRKHLTTIELYSNICSSGNQRGRAGSVIGKGLRQWP
jgi:hypothetical protein